MSTHAVSTHYREAAARAHSSTRINCLLGTFLGSSSYSSYLVVVPRGSETIHFFSKNFNSSRVMYNLYRGGI